MTYKIIRHAEYSDGFDIPKFEDFISTITYEEYGSLFPELTEEEFNIVIQEMKRQAVAGVGDEDKNFPGVISVTHDATANESIVTIEFENEQAYLNFIDYHLKYGPVEGYVLPFLDIESRYYGDDVIQGRVMVSSADPELPPGLVLRLGTWIGKKWQIYRKSNVSYSVVET